MKLGYFVLLSGFLSTSLLAGIEGDFELEQQQRYVPTKGEYQEVIYDKVKEKGVGCLEVASRLLGNHGFDGKDEKFEFPEGKFDFKFKGDDKKARGYKKLKLKVKKKKIKCKLK